MWQRKTFIHKLARTCVFYELLLLCCASALNLFNHQPPRFYIIENKTLITFTLLCDVTRFIHIYVDIRCVCIIKYFVHCSTEFFQQIFFFVNLNIFLLFALKATHFHCVSKGRWVVWSPTKKLTLVWLNLKIKKRNIIIFRTLTFWYNKKK